MPPRTNGSEAITLTAAALWFLGGFGLVFGFQAWWVGVHDGNWTVLVKVGSHRPHRDQLASELGPLVYLDELGHDGQFNYMIARDPWCLQDPELYLPGFDMPRYRYRRILFPLLAGGGGLFSPRLTLAGLIFWLAVGNGLVAVAAADLAAAWKLPAMAPLLVVFNLGAILSAQILTGDVLALGLALLGVAWWERRAETAAAVALAGAFLVKDTAFLVGLSIVLAALTQNRLLAAVRLLVLACLPLLVWSLWIQWRLPGGQGLNNFTFPGGGIIDSFPFWQEKLTPLIAGSALILFLAFSIYLGYRTSNPILKWSCFLWAGLALFLSDGVWAYPANAFRALCPLWTFAVMSYFTVFPLADAAAAKNPEI